MRTKTKTSTTEHTEGTEKTQRMINGNISENITIFDYYN
jgi:hypothetical protein